jgi:hypothetical protein
MGDVRFPVASFGAPTTLPAMKLFLSDETRVSR